MRFFNSSLRSPGQQPLHKLPNLTNNIHALFSKQKHKAQDFFLALCTKHLRPANPAGEVDFIVPEILYRGKEASELTSRDRETVKDLFDRLVDHVDSITIADHGEGPRLYGWTQHFLDRETRRKSSEIFISAHVVMQLAEVTTTLRTDPKNDAAATSRIRYLTLLATTILHELVHAIIWMQGIGSWQAEEDELTDTPDRVSVHPVEPIFENGDHNEMGNAFENYLLGGRPSCRWKVPDCGGEVLTLVHPKLSRKALGELIKRGLFVPKAALEAATEDEVCSVIDIHSLARLWSKAYWADPEAEGGGRIDLDIVACATMFGSNGPIRTQWKPEKDRHWTQGVALFPDVENTVLTRYKEGSLHDLGDAHGE